ncbi:hypothetical protein, no similarity [Maudiozyma saulgeensis]|uniref:Uncharacterized protein n=1 Tax=Maudiozyma saulgeensis TaxID=1789683 RepID=A0A1X7QYP6_9SACH|nr:hypothetical protein, no similarity [Kazachstania saulgeensis]
MLFFFIIFLAYEISRLWGFPCIILQYIITAISNSGSYLSSSFLLKLFFFSYSFSSLSPTPSLPPSFTAPPPSFAGVIPKFSSTTKYLWCFGGFFAEQRYRLRWAAQRRRSSERAVIFQCKIRRFLPLRHWVLNFNSKYASLLFDRTLVSVSNLCLIFM